jgi:hypothetical protein
MAEFRHSPVPAHPDTVVEICPNPAVEALIMAVTSSAGDMSAGNHLSAFPSDDPLSLELSHPRDPVAGAPPLEVGQRQCHEAPEQPAPQFGIDPIGACAK